MDNPSQRIFESNEWNVRPGRCVSNNDEGGGSQGLEPQVSRFLYIFLQNEASATPAERRK